MQLVEHPSSFVSMLYANNALARNAAGALLLTALVVSPLALSAQATPTSIPLTTAAERIASRALGAVIGRSPIGARLKTTKDGARLILEIYPLVSPNAVAERLTPTMASITADGMKREFAMTGVGRSAREQVRSGRQNLRVTDSYEVSVTSEVLRRWAAATQVRIQMLGYTVTLRQYVEPLTKAANTVVASGSPSALTPVAELRQPPRPLPQIYRELCW
jgi:hypothetical protein